jgi:hypothetical protein
MRIIEQRRGVGVGFGLMRRWVDTQSASDETTSPYLCIVVRFIFWLTVLPLVPFWNDGEFFLWSVSFGWTVGRQGRRLSMHFGPWQFLPRTEDGAK